jgi:hypothetical protein
LRVDDVARNFDGNAFLGFTQIGEFGFHRLILYRREDPPSRFA